MNKETYLEMIVQSIKDIIDNVLNDLPVDITPMVFEDLYESKQLCDKLLTYDYFKNSEDYLNKKIDKGATKTFKSFDKIAFTWDLMQRREKREKEKDIKKLFKLIVDVDSKETI